MKGNSMNLEKNRQTRRHSGFLENPPQSNPAKTHNNIGRKRRQIEAISKFFNLSRKDSIPSVPASEPSTGIRTALQCRMKKADRGARNRLPPR